MAYNQPGNPFKKTKYISAAEGFDPLGVAETLKNNPYAMMSKDYTRVQEGQFTREATLEDQRNEYQRRIRQNIQARNAAKKTGADYEYINPHTGEVRVVKGRGNAGAAAGQGALNAQQNQGSGGGNVQQSMKDVDVGISRNQGFENPMDYESGRPRVNPDAYNRRKSNRRQRQTRRANKKRARQKRREMEGGFFSRLFGGGGRLGPREWSRGEF